MVTRVAAGIGRGAHSPCAISGPDTQAPFRIRRGAMGRVPPFRATGGPMTTRHARSISASVLVLAVFASGSVMAQDPTRTQMRQESKGEVAFAPTYATLLVAVNDAPAVAAKIEGLTSLKPEQVRIVDAKPLVGATNEDEFSGAVQRNKAATQAAQAALQKNQVIVKALADHPAKPAIADVIGVDDRDDGDLIIYFRSKM